MSALVRAFICGSAPWDPDASPGWLAQTRAVHSIPVSASVPDRIGLGLAKVGPRLFMTSVTDILILATVGFAINLRPVREFCTFACVLIFVDWWMLHTFFLTVLSIDCQRLELADLLQQGTKSQVRKAAENGAVIPNDKDVDISTTPSRPPRKTATTKAKFGRLWGLIRRARSARIGSLSLVGYHSTVLARTRLRLTSALLTVHSPFDDPLLRQRVASLAVGNPTRAVRLQRRTGSGCIGWFRARSTPGFALRSHPRIVENL